MVIVRLKGGLGNQMFQYAFAKQLQKKYCISEIKLDTSYYSRSYKVSGTQYNSIDYFDVHYEKATSEDLKEVCKFRHTQKPMTLSYRIPIFLEMLLNKKYYHIRDFSYVNPKELLAYSYLDGSWQCPKYLEGIEGLLREEFVYKNPISEKVQIQIDRVKSENSVFIGVRRGDYVKPANINLYGELGERYYNKAISLIKTKVENPVFYVMSDDIEWVKNNIHFDEHVTYRTKEMIGNAHEEMMFMSSCKHAIIPNSTFHWWGAWLIPGCDKIITVPYPWFADGTAIDITPSTWTKLER